MEQQTNKFLSVEDFKERIEPSLISLLEMNQFDYAQDHMVNVLTSYSMEPELRIELLFSIAASQVMQARHQQEKLVIRGKTIAKQVGITQVEAEAVGKLIQAWVVSHTSKKEQDDETE